MNTSAQALDRLINTQYTNINQLVVLRNNQCLQHYCAPDFELNTAVHIASVTKSVLSALIGIAIDKQFIRSVDDKILNYFADYTLKRGEKTLPSITIRHLLTMTAPYKYRYEPYTKVYSTDDWTVACLDLLGGRAVLGEFNYTTVGLQVLSGLLVNATGYSVLDFAEQFLFAPLGIKVSKSISITSRTEYFDVLKNAGEPSWACDPKGVNTAGWGLKLTAVDMAKIGQLYLNKGMWQGERLISELWIEQSTVGQSASPRGQYGFLWWVMTERDGDFAAIGDSGNIIYVSTTKGLVVAIASRYQPRAKDRLTLIEQYLLPLYGS